jgi:hypothetical protein
MLDVPSVTRKEGIRTFDTIIPFNKPVTAPTLNPARTAKIIPALLKTNAATNADKATMDPIERSISAADIVKVMPTAMTDIMAVCRRMFMRFSGDKKPLLKSVMEKNNKTSPKLIYTI